MNSWLPQSDGWARARRESAPFRHRAEDASCPEGRSAFTDRWSSLAWPTENGKDNSPKKNTYSC